MTGLEFCTLGLDLPRQIVHNQINLSQAVQGSKLSNLIQMDCKDPKLPEHLHELLMVTGLPQVEVLEIPEKLNSSNICSPKLIFQVVPCFWKEFIVADNILGPIASCILYSS